MVTRRLCNCHVCVSNIPICNLCNWCWFYYFSWETWRRRPPWWCGPRSRASSRTPPALFPRYPASSQTLRSIPHLRWNSRIGFIIRGWIYCLEIYDHDHIQVSSFWCKKCNVFVLIFHLLSGLADRLSQPHHQVRDPGRESHIEGRGRGGGWCLVPGSLRKRGSGRGVRS